MNAAVLVRKRGPTWEFVPSAIYHRNVHVTRTGTVYGLMFDATFINTPIWIGRWIPKDRIWVTWGSELGALHLEFSNGGIYYFPRK